MSNNMADPRCLGYVVVHAHLDHCPVDSATNRPGLSDGANALPVLKGQRKTNSKARFSDRCKRRRKQTKSKPIMILPLLKIIGGVTFG